MSDERGKTYLPDIDERCLNCGRGYARHDGSSCYPAEEAAVLPAREWIRQESARRNDEAAKREMEDVRRLAPVDVGQLELGL